MSMKQDAKLNYIVALEISSVASGDGGEYKVFAKNKVGEGSANINLNFDDKDDKPMYVDIHASLSVSRCYLRVLLTQKV